MNVLESPLEALALNYLSFGILTAVNNLWTWVAVITAAVSFWRIKSAGALTRATSCSPKPDLQPHTDDPNATGSQSQSQSQTVPEILPSESVFEPPSVPSFCDVKADVGETKGGKFTLYYDQEEEESESDGEITVVKEWGDMEYRNECEEEGWERVMRVRVMEMGWRRYQDLTVINGNIVRLWDECKIRDQRHSLCCLVVD